MKIYIEFDGSIAKCLVSDNNSNIKKAFNMLSKESKIKVLDAFRVIEQDYNRNKDGRK